MPTNVLYSGFEKDFDIDKPGQYNSCWLRELAKVVNLQFCEDGPWENCDCLLVYWRWLVPGRPERNACVYRQTALIDDFVRKGRKVVVFDGDHKLSAQDRKELMALGVTVCSPELVPAPGVKQLFYPMPSCFLDTSHNTKFLKPRCVYIGTQYERDESLLRYAPHKHVLHLYGGWELDVEGRKVKTLPKIPMREVTTVMANYTTTLLLGKESYYASGLIGFRWYEALLSGVVPAIPDKFLPALGTGLGLDDLIVSDGADVDKLMGASVDLSGYRNFVKQLPDLESWKETLIC